MTAPLELMRKLNTLSGETYADDCHMRIAYGTPRLLTGRRPAAELCAAGEGVKHPSMCATECLQERTE